MFAMVCFRKNRKDVTRKQEQKGCHKETRGAGDLLYTSSRRAKQGGKMWPWRRLTTKNPYDMVLQTWIIAFLKMYKISDKLEVDTIKREEIKKKEKKRVPQTNKKSSRNQALQQQSTQRD